MKHLPPDFPIIKFWRNVNRGEPDECWAWKGALNKKGYGLFDYKKQHWRANRVAYELTYGPLPDDKPLACHSCDYPRCCNPAHLWAGSEADNIADGILKGRMWLECTPEFMFEEVVLAIESRCSPPAGLWPPAGGQKSPWSGATRPCSA